MADALISTPVAVTAGAISIALIAVATTKIKREKSDGNVALMGVLGAFVFAAQMINFSIPGTGSSGHIIGGLLLAAMLGPWRAFITICSVLIVQCLVFADGGLLALGCNIINMGAMSCLVAYPLIFKPIMDRGISSSRLVWASVLASVVGLEFGALLVSVETVLSGITELPFGTFLLFLLPIHLAIGICEGVATGLVLTFVYKKDPSLLCRESTNTVHNEGRGAWNKKRVVLYSFAAAALVLAVAFTWIASSNPDGLEWSILQVTGATELAPAVTPSTAFIPDYDSHWAGIVGALIVLTMLWALSALLFRRKKSSASVTHNR